MSSSFRCAVMTPAGARFDGEVSYASFPAWDGQYGVMAGMAPLLDRVGLGPLRLDTEDGTRWFAVEDGFAHVRENTLTILSERVTAIEELSVGELEAELREFDAASHDDLTADERLRRRQRIVSRLEMVERHRGDKRA